jgi:hypothetical protein
VAEARPDPGSRALRAALAGVAAFALGYLLPGTLQLPTLAYDPVRHALSVQRTLSGLQMRYFSDLLTASCASLVAAAIAHRLDRRQGFGVAAGVALSLVALDVAYYLSRLLAAV